MSCIEPIKVYRFTGNVEKKEFKEFVSVIDRVTEIGQRIFLEGEAITSNIYEGMKFRKFSQFNQITDNWYEMYSLEPYYQYDKSRFLRLFNKKIRQYEEKIFNSYKV